MTNELNVIRWDFRLENNLFEKILQIDDEKIKEVLSSRGVDKFILLRTCNRLEIYYDLNVRFSNEEFPNHTWICGEDAIRHLFRVSSGLESLSVGENEIIRQIKDAYEAALKDNRSNKFLSTIFLRAIKVGKYVREHTNISRGKVSIPSIMIDEIEKRKLLNGKSIGIVGTGKMAATITKYLQKTKVAKITLYGRNEEAGKELSQLFGVNFKRTLDFQQILYENDVVITATSSKIPLLSRAQIEAVDKRILIVDIANPKNVEDNYINPNVEIINLEMATKIMDENRIKKEQEIIKSENIIEEEIKKALSKIAEEDIENYISSLYIRGRKIVMEEYLKLKREIKKVENEERIIEDFVNSVVNKILAPETETLKKMIREKKWEGLREFIESFDKKDDIDEYLFDSDSEDPGDSQNQQDQNHRLSQTP